MTKQIREHVPDYTGVKIILAYEGSVIYESVCSSGVLSEVLDISDDDVAFMQKQVDKLKMLVADEGK